MPHHFFWHVLKEESGPLVNTMVAEPPCIGSWEVLTAKYGPSWPKGDTVELSAKKICINNIRFRTCIYKDIF